MKKLFLLLLLFSLHGQSYAVEVIDPSEFAPATAASTADKPVEPAPPKWDEFAPAQYANSSLVEVPKYHRIRSLILSELTLGLYLPFAFSAARKRNNALTNNYWVKRRSAFDAEVETCAASTGDKALCFMGVRQIESQKNIAYNQSLQMAQLQRQQAIYNMNRSAEAFQARVQQQQTQNQLQQLQNTANQIKARRGPSYNCTGIGSLINCSPY